MKVENTVENVMMLEEGYPRLGFKAFSSLISEGVASLCISRLHPEYVSEKFSLKGPKFYWLTGNRYESAISPKSLSPLVKVIKQESKGRKLVVFLDGLEYLLLWNDMKKAIACLNEIGRILKANGGALYVSIDPLTFEQKDLDRIWEMFPHIQSSYVLKEQAQQIVATVPKVEGPVTLDLRALKGLSVSP